MGRNLGGDGLGTAGVTARAELGLAAIAAVHFHVLLDWQAKVLSNFLLLIGRRRRSHGHLLSPHAVVEGRHVNAYLGCLSPVDCDDVLVLGVGAAVCPTGEVSVSGCGRHREAL